MLITQTSRTAIINWGGFSIGQGNAVRFENGAGVTLNRVTGLSRSQIDGALSASGSVYLVNPNGITVGPSGTVTTGGSFIAATHDVSDTAFRAGGDLTFRGTSKASVINYGAIGSLGGDVALIARWVDNAGAITAPNGTVGLAAGYEVLMRDTALSDGKFVVKVGGGDTEAKTSGAIRAAEVELKANGGNVYALAGNTDSLTKATGVANKGGRIFLTAGPGGTVTASQKVVARSARTNGKAKGGEIRVSGGKAKITGSLDAKGEGAKAGAIVVTAKEVELAAGAVLDASGTEGGLVLVGGDYQGGAGATRYLGERLETARATTVAAGAIIRADGLAGAGGKVVVWSDQATSFAGTISARGAGSAAGGDAEVSGKAVLDYRGTADLRSETGAFGTLLLDPYNLTISTGTSSGVTGFNASAPDSVLNVGTLTSALATANVTVTTGSGGGQAGNIIVDTPVSWGTTSMLTLSAYGSVTVNQSIQGGAGSRVVLRADNAGTGTGSVTFNNGAQITATGGVALYYNPISYAAPTSYASAQTPGTVITAYMLVNTVENLQAMNAALSGTYALGRDIDASATAGWNSGAGFVPVGDSTAAFTGRFDGDGHVISNLYINRQTADSVGLFGRASDADIRNVTLTDAEVTGSLLVGALLGDGLNVTITNAHAAAQVTGDFAIGGLVGNLDGGAISGSHASGIVNGTIVAGGLVGNVLAGTSIDNSYAIGTVQGDTIIGGLVGSNDGVITNAYATGAVTGTSQYVGGLVGETSTASQIITSFATGAVSGLNFVGGLVGGGAGSISQSYATGAVTGNADVGGLIGQVDSGTITESFATGSVAGAGDTSVRLGGLVGNLSDGSIARSYATGQVRGGSNIGGLVGQLSSGTIADSYAMGSVTGVGTNPMRLGGLVGYLRGGNVATSYATGWVSGGTAMGGLAGERLSGVVTQSYWNTQTTGQTISAGGGTGLTTAQLQSGLPTGFSSTVWGTGANLYPYFKWQYATAPVAVSGIAYGADGTTALAGAGVTAVSGGSVFGASATGANGYYYILSGSALGAQGVLTYLDGGAAPGATFSDVAGVNGIQNVTLYQNTATILTDQSTLSAAQTDYVATRGSYTDTELAFLSPASFASLTTAGYGVRLDATSSLTLDTDLGSGGALALGGSGTLGVSGTRAVSAAGQMTVSAPLAWSDGSTLTLTSTGAGLTMNGTVTAENGQLEVDVFDTATATDAIDVGTFSLEGGTWSQVGTLADFAAADFRIQSGATFLRVTGGTGAAATPYLIADVYGLQGMASESLLASHFALAGNIDASSAALWNSGAGFESIGTSADLFTGSLNGAGYTISSLLVDRASGDAGLFGHVGTAGAISNLTVTGVVNGQFAGLLVAQNAGTLTNVRGTGTVTTTAGDGYAGGLVGLNTGTLSKAFADVAVTAGNNAVAGGLVGANAAETDSFGAVIHTGLVEGSGAYGAVSAGTNGAAGGLIGQNMAVVEASFASGTVDGDTGTHVGGLVGDNTQQDTLTPGVIRTSFASGAVTSAGGAASLAGGLVGFNTGSVEDSYATGAVSGADFTGGLAGRNTGSIARTYATGAVSGSGANGGLAGANLGTVTASFWNTVSTGQAAGTSIGGSAGMTGLDAEGMTSLAVYADAGWNIDDAGGTGAVWRIYDGYTAPLLRSFLKGLTVTGGAGSKTYDGSTTSSSVGTLTYSDSGYDPSDVLGTGFYTAGPDAGSYSGAALQFGGLYSTQFGYDLTLVSGSLVINQRAITVTADGQSRVYGDANPALTYTVGGLGLVGSDSLSGSLATTATTASNVGAYGITQGTLGNANYAITYTGADLTVTQRSITVTANAQSRVYGDANPALTYTVGGQGLANGDSLAGSLATTATTTSNVGTYGITQGTLGNANYAITTYTGADLTVTQRSISVAANAQSRAYGDANPALTYTVGGQGLANGDSLTGSLATTATVLSGVGAYGITQGSLAASANYTLTAYTGADLTVIPRSITVTADAQSRAYGDANPALTYTVGGQGLANGDTLAGALATIATAQSNVGGYGITLGTLAASANYTLTGYTGAILTVAQRSITVTALPSSAVYGTGLPGFDYTVGGQGLVNGDSLTGALATTASATPDVGSYAITPGSLAASANYTMSFTEGLLAITPAPLTISVLGANKTYDGLAWSGGAGVSASGFVYGETLAVLGGTLVYGGAAQGAVNAGSYQLTASGLTSGNYAITYAPGTLDIARARLTVAAADASMIYGAAVPGFAYGIVSGQLFGSDTLTGALASTATSASSVGTYAITQGTLAATANYDLSYVGGALSITPRPLLVVADNAERVEGQGNPVFTYGVGGMGLVNGDTLTGELTSEASRTSAPGSYAITQGTLAASLNYVISYVPGLLTVTPDPVPTDTVRPPFVETLAPDDFAETEMYLALMLELRLRQIAAMQEAAQGTASGLLPVTYNLPTGPWIRFGGQ